MQKNTFVKSISVSKHSREDLQVRESVTSSDPESSFNSSFKSGSSSSQFDRKVIVTRLQYIATLYRDRCREIGR